MTLTDRFFGHDASKAFSVALAPGDGEARIFVTGCERSWGSDGLSKGLGDGEWRGDGFVAGFTGSGVRLWVYRFEPQRSRPGASLWDRGPSTCGTSVAVASGGDLFVGGTYFGVPPAAETAGHPMFGKFVARLSGGGRVRWSQALGKPEVNVRLVPLPGDRVAVTAPFERGKKYVAGLVAFDGLGNRQWEVFDTADPWGVAWTADGLSLAVNGDQILWGGGLVRDARLGSLVIERAGACSFVAAVDKSGRPLAVTPMPGPDCSVTAMTGGETPWVAGALDDGWGAGAFVHRLGGSGESSRSGR
jgi:hypothetical protein